MFNDFVEWQLPGETERSSAGTQLREGYPRPGASMMHEAFEKFSTRTLFLFLDSIVICALQVGQPPKLVISHHRIEDHQEFSHRGNQSYFLFFSGSYQTLIKRFDLRVVSSCHHRHHVQYFSNLRPTAKDLPFAIRFRITGIIVDRRHAHQLGNLAAIELAQLG